MAKSADSLPEKNVNRDSVDANNNNGSRDNCPSSNLEGTTVVKYQLRPRSSQPRRWNHYEWNFQERIKHKSRQQQPLSRYRRKTANARERFRMRQINTAFENLRGVLPPWVCSRRSAADLTKITTLKLASAYIRTLQDVLDGKTQQEESPFSKIFSSDMDESCTVERMSPLHNSIDGSAIYHQISQSHAVNESELVTFLRGASDAGVVPTNLENLSYIAPVSEDDPVTLLLLECDPIQSWEEGQEVPMVL